MPTPARPSKPDAAAKKISDEMTEEKMEGMLENIFGVKMPELDEAYQSNDEQKFASVLENIYGVQLPSEMVTRAYSIFIKEYKES